MRSLVLVTQLLITLPVWAADPTLSERVEALDKASKSQRTSDYYFACDGKHLPLKKKLAAIVDEKKSQIKLTAEDFKNSDWLFVKVGPGEFRHTAPDFKASSDDSKWSWETADAWYELVKNEPLGKKWYDFSREVSALIDSDEDLFINDEPNLSKESPKKYRQIIALLKKCLKDSKCALTKKETKKIADFCLEHAAHGKHGFALEEAPLKRSIQEPSMKGLLDELEGYYASRFGFTKNPGVRRISKTEIALPLEAGAFAGEEKAIAGYIEDRWTSPALKVRVEWTTKAENPLAYAFTFNPDFTARSSVIRKEQRIDIVNYVRTRVFAHEIGHVLGFRDVYFYPRNNETCVYSDETPAGDLMADASNGEVTAEQWAELDRQYPYSPPAR